MHMNICLSWKGVIIGGKTSSNSSSFFFPLTHFIVSFTKSDCESTVDLNNEVNGGTRQCTAFSNFSLDPVFVLRSS